MYSSSLYRGMNVRHGVGSETSAFKEVDLSREMPFLQGRQ